MPGTTAQAPRRCNGDEPLGGAPDAGAGRRLAHDHPFARRRLPRHRRPRAPHAGDQHLRRGVCPGARSARDRRPPGRRRGAGRRGRAPLPADRGPGRLRPDAASAGSVEQEPVLVSRVVLEVIEQERELVSDHRIAFSGPKDAVADAADTAMVRHVIRNLLDNAVSYAPAGGTVQVVVQQTPDEVVVRVLDDSPLNGRDGVEPSLALDGATARAAGRTARRGRAAPACRQPARERHGRSHVGATQRRPRLGVRVRPTANGLSAGARRPGPRRRPAGRRPARSGHRSPPRSRRPQPRRRPRSPRPAHRRSSHP